MAWSLDRMRKIGQVPIHKCLKDVLYSRFSAELQDPDKGQIISPFSFAVQDHEYAYVILMHCIREMTSTTSQLAPGMKRAFHVASHETDQQCIEVY